MPPPSTAGPVRVALGVLRRADGRVLVAERDARRHQGGGLEFPGGKCEPGEAVGDALGRELAEELGIRVTAAEPLMRVRHAYADRAVELAAWLVTGWDGEPAGAERQRLDWLAPGALDPARFPAANRPLVAALSWSPYCLVTPDIDRVPDDDALLAGLDGALRGGRVGLVRFRRRDQGGRRALMAAAAARCAEYGATLLVDCDPSQLDGLPAGTGLHLTTRSLLATEARPVAPDRLLSCACHDAGQLAHAEALGADLALLGPVSTTPTHPDAHPLGWSGFEALAARTTLPLYALGGVGPGDLARAREAGAVGVAGIRGFWPREGGG